MDKIEKIRQEIKELGELLEDHNYYLDNSEQALGYSAALDDIEKFLSTLESEKPMNPEDAMKELNEKIALVKQRGTWDGVDVDKYMDEVRGREPEKPMDLEEEVKRYYSDNFAYISSDQPTLSILTNIARHFAEWGYLRAAEKYNEIEYNRQRAEEKPMEQDGLEEELERFIASGKSVTVDDYGTYKVSYHDFKKVARHFAEWQKEQMLKEAVGVQVVGEQRDLRLIDSTQRCLFNAKRGDWLEIIIVKED